MLPCYDTENIIRIDLIVEGETRWFRAEKHIHSFTSMFDPAERRMGTVLRGRSAQIFHVENADPFDGYIKLNGVWPDNKDSIRSWVSDGKMGDVFSAPKMNVVLNGTKIFADQMHMPIVCAGWPSVYLQVPPGALHKGCNELTLETDGDIFLLNQCSVFVRSNAEKSVVPLFIPRVLAKGRNFSVTLSFYKPVGVVNVEHDDSIEHAQSPSEYVLGENDFFFKAVKPAKAPKLRFVVDGEYIDIQLPSILDVPEGLPCYVGTDSDDHRHDNTGMMSETLKYLFRSGIGDLVMFRPKPGRNCLEPPNADLCNEWIDIVNRFKASYLLCNWTPAADFPEEVYPRLAKDPSFIGCHAHEPYFMMFEPTCTDRIRNASNFQERRDAMVDALKSWANERHALGVGAVCGEASWLAAYDAESGYDVINTEVVTGFGPQFAAVRGALRGRPNMKSGHHIAIEWYLGYPYDDLKTHRFWLMALLTFTHGSTYIYTENSLFFTNSYERYDPEDKFTTNNRALMRNLYDIARLQPRSGEQCPELAVAYGNLEAMLWCHDDLLPETDDASDWANLVWNKWSADFYKPAMRALDAWLPTVEIERYHKNRTIMKWFSGNPYGNVDMVSMERTADILKQYKTLAILGWNTMTNEVFEKLNEYVYSGGTLFISGCHFDRRLLPDGEYQIDTAGAEKLLGLSVIGPASPIGDVKWNDKNYPQSDGPRLCEFNKHGAEVLISDENGHPVLLHNKFGDGLVYFGNFWDHPSSPDVLALTTAIMSMLGEKAKSDFGLGDCYGINCSHWYDSENDIRRLYLVNVNWQKPRTSQMCKITLWGEDFSSIVKSDNMSIVTIKDGIAVIPDSPYIYVDSINVDDKECRIRLIGTGHHVIRVILADSTKNLKLKADSDGEPGRDCTLVVSLTGDDEILFDICES